MSDSPSSSGSEGFEIGRDWSIEFHRRFDPGELDIEAGNGTPLARVSRPLPAGERNENDGESSPTDDSQPSQDNNSVLAPLPGSQVNETLGHSRAPSALSTMSFEEDQRRIMEAALAGASEGGGSTSTPPSAKPYFSRSTARSKSEIVAKQVSVPKYLRGDPGSTQRLKNEARATEALASKFGAAKHFVTHSQGGEPDTGNNNYANIQEELIGNGLKLKKLSQRMTQFDMMDCIMIPALKDETTDDPGDRWGDESTKISLLQHWSKLTLDQVLKWQEDTNLYSEDDMDSSDWLKQLLVNSSDDDLNKRVDEKYDELEETQKGGVVRLKLQLDEMFYMSPDVVNALQEWLRLFETTGVTRLQGENVAFGADQFEVVCVRLAEVKQLPFETPKWLLGGLIKCTISEFTGPLELMLNTERISQTKEGVSLSGDAEKTLTRVRAILAHARSSFHSLSTSQKWNVANSNKRFNPCFNCDGNHGVDKCDKPRDEARIERNRKAFEERKKGNQSSGGGARRPWGSGGRGNSGRGRGDGGRGGRGRGNGGCGHGGRGGSSGGYGSGVAFMGGRWLCHCNKGCGWNDTHTSGFHDRWNKNPGSFSLPATHEFTRRCAEGTPGGGASSGGDANGGTAGAAQRGAQQQANGFLSEAKAKRLAATCEKHKALVSDPEISSLLADLHKELLN